MPGGKRRRGEGGRGAMQRHRHRTRHRAGPPIVPFRDVQPGLGNEPSIRATAPRRVEMRDGARPVNLRQPVGRAEGR